MAQGGINLLSIAAANAEDPQTLRMIAGAIANLCGNGNLPSFVDINYCKCVCSFDLANRRSYSCVQLLKKALCTYSVRQDDILWSDTNTKNRYMFVLILF